MDLFNLSPEEFQDKMRRREDAFLTLLYAYCKKKCLDIVGPKISNLNEDEFTSFLNDCLLLLLERVDRKEANYSSIAPVSSSLIYCVWNKYRNFWRSREFKANANTINLLDDTDPKVEKALREILSFDDPDFLAENEALVKKMKQAFDQLNSTCQMILKWSFFQHIPIKNIAEKLNMKPNTVSVRKKDCLEKLRKELQ